MSTYSTLAYEVIAPGNRVVAVHDNIFSANAMADRLDRRVGIGSYFVRQVRRVAA